MTQARHARHRSTELSHHAHAPKWGFWGWVSGAAVVSLIAGMLVVTGGVQQALAASPAPSVGVTLADPPYLAGEDVDVTLSLTSAGAAAGDTFNLSAGVVLSADVTLVNSGTLGAPLKTYTAADGPIAGAYVTPTSMTAGACQAIGLDPVTPAQTNGACQVPVGKQYIIFQNISDLPKSATTSHTITLRPKAGTYPAGSTFGLTASAFTSDDARYLPVFPGSGGVAAGIAHTSDRGGSDFTTPVSALRITKTEPNPESELLRGVHNNTTTYTLQLHHTGEGDISNTLVTDFLPAGLEYLGLGGVDNTTNANGNRGEQAEYPGAPSLSATPAPFPAPFAGQTAGETVETVIPTAQEVADYGLVAGKVYTKVTWNMGTLLATSDLRGTTPGVKQVYAGTAGKPGLIEIRYRAAVPLFENTLDFGYAANTIGQQTANLDNNRGASTRHGLDGGPGYDAQAQTNVAVASGSYAGNTTSTHTSHTVDAVDVRLLKSVDDSEFKQGSFARYTLDLATSEYVGGDLAGPGQRPQRLTDELGNGICPVFPASVPVTPGASSQSGLPNLVIGNPKPGNPPVTANMTQADWNAALSAAGVDAVCQFPSPSANTAAENLSGATLTGIAFDRVSGHFFLDFGLDPVTALSLPNATHQVKYSAAQNSVYRNTQIDGATSSGDRIVNTAEIAANTYSIPALQGVTSATGADAFGNEIAWDDSAAQLAAPLSKLNKWVLPRERGVPTSTTIASEPIAPTGSQAGWVKTAETPFTIGDEVWYRLQVKPPVGADVRNPKLTDYLPAGVTFNPSQTAGRYDNIVVKPSAVTALGTCAAADEAAWVNQFVPNPTVNGPSLTWEFGANCGIGGTDRFLPLNTAVDIYIKVTVTDVSTAAAVDFPENLAKYQQNNVEGEIFFLRDAASFELDQAANLVKGVHSINGLPVPAHAFGSNVDHQQVAQTDQVTYRLDLTAPRTDTTGYIVWDALPKGIKKADLVGIQAGGTFSSATAAMLQQTWVSGAWVPSEVSQTTGWTAHAYDFGDVGYPADLRQSPYQDDQRSVIVWTYTGVVPGSIAADDSVTPVRPAATRGLTLGYTITVPDGTGTSAAALAGQNYSNTASIVQLQAVSNGGGGATATMVPQGDDTLSTAAPTPGQFGVAQDGTVDGSDIFLPDDTLAKALVQTEIAPTGTTPVDANNATTAIVQGEYATYDVSVTVPAHTSVSKGFLKDDGFLRWAGAPTPPNTRELAYHLDSAVIQVAPWLPGSMPAGFSLDWVSATKTGTGALTFPALYTNDTASPQTFTVRLTVRIDDRDESHPAFNPDLPDGKTLTNTARFTFQNADGESANLTPVTADVTYREPSPSLEKTIVGTPGGADGLVKYRLTAGNASGHPALYDAVVYDCLPAGLGMPAAAPGWNFTPAQGTATVSSQGGGKCRVDDTVTGQIGQKRVVPDTAGTGTLIEWNVGRIDGGATTTLEFTAQIDAAAGGGVTYTNTAHIVGYTLPGDVTDPSRRGDRATDASRDVRINEATIAKSVSPTSAPVGDTVTYTLVTTIPANANFYNVALTDELPKGLSYVAGSSAVTTVWGGPGTAPGVGTDGVSTHEPVVTPGTGTNGDGLAWAINPGKIETHSAARTITLTFQAKVTNAVASATPKNWAQFAWNQVDGGGSTTEKTARDDVDLTITDPLLSIVKDVKHQGAADSSYADSKTGEVNQGFTYRLNVTNATGTTRSAAHHITVTDTVPTGVVVTAGTISNGGVITGAGANGGGTITWTLAGPLAPGATQSLTYDATFASSSTLTATALVNTGKVTRYESFASDGRVYQPTNVQDTARVTPLFPAVTLTKAAADSSKNAYVGEPFEWVLTATNSGTGAAQKVTLTDTLPANWTFTAMTSITVAGTTVTNVDPSGTPSGPLGWEFGQDATDGTPAAVLQPGQSIVIRYTATPTNPDALTTPGVGSSKPHTNTLAASTTDRTNHTSNATGAYTGPNATDSAFLREANLNLVKQAIGGVISQAQSGQPDVPADNLYGLAAGTWVPGQATQAGKYAQPQWQVTVVNHGPDAGFGPFRVVETPSTPSGVTLGTWSARYYGSASDTTGTALTLTGTGTGADPFIVGGATTSLKANGSDRIVLTANVNTTAAATATGTELVNWAQVRGRTYEDPRNFSDNEDAVAKELSPQADLTVSKVVSSPVPPAVPNVGAAITWQLTASNLGPAVSVSTATNPITVTDMVPPGVSNVNATANADWTVAVTRGGAPSTFPAAAGDLITWTYTGAAMPVGAAAAVTVTGTINTSHTGVLSNTAIVNPGDTPDPNPSNNTSEARVTPNDSTTMSIVKTRVVPDGAVGWRQADPLTHPTDAFVAGEPVHYLITVRNNGPADARTVKVVDETPAGLTYSTHASVTGTWAYASGGTTSVYPSGAPTGRTFSTFTLSGTQVAGAANDTSFVVTYDTAPTIVGNVVNWAEVTIANWDPTDPGGTFKRDDDNTGSTRIVDLGVTKSHAAGTFTPGTEVTYTLTAKNWGPSATNGVISIEDSLPVGLSYVANSAQVTLPGGSATQANPVLSGTDNRVLTWGLLAATDTFNLNAEITVTFKALIDPTLRENSTLVNVVTVDGPDNEPLPDPHPNRAEDSITTGATAATMAIAKTVAPGPWVAGTNVSYTLTVTNSGPSAAPATVTDTLPAGLTLVSMSGTNWNCPTVTVGASSGVCDYLDTSLTNPVARPLHPVGTSTITVVAAIAPSVVTGTVLTNNAEVQWTDGQGTRTDDDDEPITVTTNADLGIVKDVITGAAGTVVADPAAATAGRTAWFRLQVTNHGTSDAVGPVTVTDTLPIGVTVPATFVATNGWTVVPGPITPGVAQTVTLTLPGGLLAKTAADPTRGTAPVIEFEVTLDPAIAHGALLTNSATVSSPTPDSNPANNTDTAQLDVSRLVDVSITKTHPTAADGTVHIGDPLDFTVRVANAGPSVATGITVTDTVPVGLEVTSPVGPIAGTGWTIASVTLADPLNPAGGATVVATYAGTLTGTTPGNEADPLVISTIVRQSAFETAPNHVVVTGTETDSDLTNNEADDPLNVRPQVTLVTTKTAVGELQVGKAGRYDITVENTGPQRDPGPITVTDVLPAGLTYASSPGLPAGVTIAVSGQTVTWTITGGLAVNQKVSLGLLVNVGQAAYPKVTNTVVVTTPSELLPPSVTTATAESPVKAMDVLSVTGAPAIGYLAALAALLLIGGGAFTAIRRRREQV